MKRVSMNSRDTYEHRKFIALFMQKMNMRVNDMVRLLDVSPNTVYNYRTMDDEDIPLKVKQQLFNILNVDSYEKARNTLINMTFDKRDEVTSTLESVLKSTITVSKIKSNNTSEKVKEDLGSIMGNEIGSKFFVDALVYEIKNVVKSKDDYDFISYVRKYKGM